MSTTNGTTGIVFKAGQRVKVKDRYGTVRFVGNTQVFLLFIFENYGSYFCKIVICKIFI
jgi:hypothetical protein